MRYTNSNSAEQTFFELAEPEAIPETGTHKSLVTMKVCAISDTHSHDIDIPKCDLLIHAGDFSYLGKAKELKLFSSQIERWKKQQPKLQIVWTPGNHELYCSEADLKEMARQTETHCLIDEGVDIDGIKIWGSPYTPEFFRWAYMYKRPTRRWEQIPEELDILVTHGPPYNVFDLVDRGEHVGCQDLLSAVTAKSPGYHIFGHIHAWGGSKIKIRGTTFINASVCDEGYQPTNPLITFNLEI